MSAAESNVGCTLRPQLGFRQLPTLGNKFTSEDVGRIVFILEQFEEAYDKEKALDAKAKAQPVKLPICSDGGDIDSGLRLCRRFRDSPIPIHAEVFRDGVTGEGFCSGAAFCVLQSCDNRSANPDTFFGFIEKKDIVSLTSRTDLLELEKRKNELVKINQQVISSVYWRLRQRYSREELRVMIENPRLISAEEALEKGFIDTIA
jgi:ATP-dependent protease ClpP protease subunit